MPVFFIRFFLVLYFNFLVLVLFFRGAHGSVVRKQDLRIRTLELCRNEMQHLVDTLQGYLITQVCSVRCRCGSGC